MQTRQTKTWPWVLVSASLVFVVAPWLAQASDPFLVVPAAQVVERSPAYRYANASEQEALDELDRRKILYQRVEPHGAVRTPIRLTGRLHGVHIHSVLAEHERPTTPFEICDARLALALDDFSALLARRGIVELVHYTMYRPSVASPAASSQAWFGEASKVGPPEAWYVQAKKSPHQSSKKKKPPRPAASAQAGSRTKKPPHLASSTPRLNVSPPRHPLGLAIDAGIFIKQDGTMLSVASHFRGQIGAQTCGPGVAPPQEPKARELWDIVCEAYDTKIFTYVLTPNFDQAHQDHFHMDLTPDVRWFLYH